MHNMWAILKSIICAQAEHPSGVRFRKTEFSWNGTPAKTYWHVEQPLRGVYIAALDKYRRVYLIEHFRAPFNEYLWEIPAGGIRPGEDLFSAAQRELLEETGVQVKDFQVLLDFAPSPGLSNSRGTIVLALNVERSQDPVENPEIRSIECIPLDEAIARLTQATPSSAISLLALALIKDALPK
jgi:8-oxo-dGTP pyrophosphatase MutT (NUDIX family)